MHNPVIISILQNKEKRFSKMLGKELKILGKRAQSLFSYRQRIIKLIFLRALSHRATHNAT